MANSLRFITGIRYYKRMLETLNNMTYIYDKQWSPDNTNKATFPVCFFHVKGYHEVMNAEVSQKQLLFYNSQSENNNADPSLDSGLLNVVADNIVIKPKTYKLDVIIPYHNITLLNQSFVYNTYTANYINTVLTGKESKLGNAMLQAYGTLNAPYTNFMQSIIKTLIGQSGIVNFNSSVDDWLRNTVQQPDYNKQSLEIMWKLRHIVKMKMWNSWEYKYVAIVDIDVTKEGTEDGVYEATITVQEMPIVTMYNEKDTLKGSSKRFIYKNPLLKLNGDIANALLDKAGGKSSFGG